MKRQYIKFPRRALSVLLASACVGMMITGCGEETVEEEIISEAIPVEVQNPQAGTLTLKNEFVGTVSPEEFVYVIPLVSAEVLSADVAVGDTVSAGQELCKLDSEAAELQLASAHAQYDSVEANVDAAEVGYEIAQAQYESAIAQLEVQNEQTQRQKDLQMYQMQVQIDSINSGIDDINEQMADLAEDKRDAEDQKSDLKKAKNRASEYAEQAERAYGEALMAYNAVKSANDYDKLQKEYEDAVKEVTMLEAIGSTTIDPDGNEVDSPELTEAKKKLDAADTALNELNTKLKHHEENINNARAAMSSAQSAVSQTESAYEQVKAGIESIEEGQEQLGDTLSDTYKSLEQTEAIKNMTEATLSIDTQPVQDASKKTAALGVDSAAATVNSAKVGAEGAKVAIDSAEYQLDMYTLRAPIDGVIEAVNVKEHDFASPNGPAFVISNKNTMTVTFNVSEGIRNTLQVGQKIQVDRNGKQYDAVITEIGTMIDQNTGLFAVKSCVSTPDDSLLTGSTVKVIADTYSQSNAILIPYDAVYYDDSQPYVYVAENGIAKRRDVETGIFDAETITVLSGLRADEVLITSWSANLRDGAEISVQSSAEQNTSVEQNTGAGQETTGAQADEE